MTITARLFGGMYDGDVILLASFRTTVEKPIPPEPVETAGALDEASLTPEGPTRLIYQFCGQHPDGTLMYQWTERYGRVRR